MIHYKREGRYLRIGLNITVGMNKRWWPWITFAWAWYKPENKMMSSWSIRIRTWQFKVFCKADKWNVIKHYLSITDEYLVSREFVEDLRLYASVRRDRELNTLIKIYSLQERL